MVKYSLKSKDVTRRAELSKRFHAVLRCTYLILQAYLHHLPLSGGHVYPTSLFTFIDIVQNFIKGSRGLSCDLSQLSQDIERLFNAAKAFERKFAESKQVMAVTSEPKPAKPMKKKVEKKKLEIDMINNLARQKFGSPNVSSSSESFFRSS